MEKEKESAEKLILNMLDTLSGKQPDIKPEKSKK